jgi:diguanylate cyclase (GGDEF)-like protein
MSPQKANSMFSSGRSRQLVFVGRLLFLALCADAAVAATSLPDDPAQLLKQADNIKTSNNTQFIQLLQQLDGEKSRLSEQQKIYLRYLGAWQVAYRGDYKSAIPLLTALIDESTDPTLRFRAGIFVVNTLANGSNYEDAFVRLSQLLDELPKVADKDARAQGLSVAAFLYNEAGQYDLALGYVDQLLKENPGRAEYACKGDYLKLDALYKTGKSAANDKVFQDGVNTCSGSGETLFANGIRSFVAKLYIQQGQSREAIELLQKNYTDVRRSQYPRLISQFDASLAEAYWQVGDLVQAQQFALDAVQGSIRNEYTEPLTTAYKVLYQIQKKQGDLDAALIYHEKYMAADKGYLNEVSAKALAFQVVNQQVLAKKLQIDTLNKQNQILQLQQALGTKAIETNRLYITLLLTILAFIAFWAYRLKRSQLSFMKLARRDGLTGIFNRQHFVASAEQQLQYCQKSGRVASLIVIDLDNFKTVNDTHGHAVGDHVLKRAVAACQAHLRSTDVFGRLGGEEFGILMPECGKDVIAGRSELIRLAIASVSDSEDTSGVVVSASFGVSTTIQSGHNLRQLLIHADKALYSAKREGRNRVVVFDDDTEQSTEASLTALPLHRR